MILTNRPTRRRDENDKVHCTASEKWNAVIEDIPMPASSAASWCWSAMTSTETNEFPFRRAQEGEKIEHQVLNANSTTARR